MLSDIHLGAFFIQYAAEEEGIGGNRRNCVKKQKPCLHFLMKKLFNRRRKMQKEGQAKTLFRQNKKIRRYAGFSTITYEIFV